jgi:hypothetical protein
VSVHFEKDTVEAEVVPGRMTNNGSEYIHIRQYDEKVILTIEEARSLAQWLSDVTRGLIYVAPPASQEEIDKLKVEWEAMYRGCPKRPCKITD